MARTDEDEREAEVPPAQGTPQDAPDAEVAADVVAVARAFMEEYADVFQELAR